jgi:hypothetical protein
LRDARIAGDAALQWVRGRIPRRQRLLALPPAPNWRGQRVSLCSPPRRAASLAFSAVGGCSGKGELCPILHISGWVTARGPGRIASAFRSNASASRRSSLAMKGSAQPSALWRQYMLSFRRNCLAVIVHLHFVYERANAFEGAWFRHRMLRRKRPPSEVALTYDLLEQGVQFCRFDRFLQDGRVGKF